LTIHLQNGDTYLKKIITGNVSFIYLSKIFENTPIKVISVNKDIADLITKKDLESVDLSEVTDTVLYPENAIVHERVLSFFI